MVRICLRSFEEFKIKFPLGEKIKPKKKKTGNFFLPGYDSTKKNDQLFKHLKLLTVRCTSNTLSDVTVEIK